MLKQKTFIFNGYELGMYNREKEQVDFDGDIINRKIDRFLKDKELVSISTACFSRGNNPPNAGIIYTIVYKEVENAEVHNDE